MMTASNFLHGKEKRKRMDLPPLCVIRFVGESKSPDTEIRINLLLFGGRLKKFRPIFVISFGPRVEKRKSALISLWKA